MSANAQPDLGRLFVDHCQAFWKALVTRNIFYLASAMLMLAGCYMVCIPYLYQRHLSGLLVLLGVINAYEILVIFATALIMRRAPKSREPFALLLIELLFLFDVTFTINACLPLDFKSGLIVAFASLLLGVVKMFALEAGSGRAIFKGLRAFLIAAMLLLYSFQALVLSTSGAHGDREFMTYVVWLAFATLPLLLSRKGLNTEFRGAADAGAFWALPKFKVAAAALTLLAVGAQLIGQSWVYHWPISYAFVLPLLLAVLVAVPAFVRDIRAWEPIRVFGMFVLIVIGWADGATQAWKFADGKFTCSPLQADLFFATLACATMWLRERRVWQMHFFCALLAVSVLGGDLDTIGGSLQRPTLVTLLSLFPAAGIWLYFNREYAPVLLVSSVLIAIGGRVLAQHADVYATRIYSQCWPALAFLIGLKMCDNRPVRAFFLAAMFCAGVHSLSEPTMANIIGFAWIAIAMSAGMLRAWKPYAALVVSYLVIGASYFYSRKIESVSFNWGWLVIGAAFGLFVLAFSISRKGFAEK